MSDSKPSFGGSVPENYDRYLVPLIFEVYADDLASRLNVAEGGAVLETAAGTGVVTRKLRARLPASVALMATDLNDAMLDVARASLGDAGGVEIRIADATDLPFPDAAFNAVVCQFGVMFFPDKQRGYAEAARVLKPGGAFLFNVWDSLAHNALVRVTHECVAALCPDDPPPFLALPFGYHDVEEITRGLRAAGFDDIEKAVLSRQSRAESAADVARGFAAGSPLLAELEARDMAGEQSVSAIETALIDSFGTGPITAPMQAIAFVAHRP